MPLPRWILYRLAAYLHGRGIVYSAEKLIPDEALHPGLSAVWVRNFAAAPGGLAGTNSIASLAPDGFNFVVVGPQISLDKDQPLVLGELVRRVQRNGHLAIAMDAAEATTEQLKEIFSHLGSWILKDEQTRDGVSFLILKKVLGNGEVRSVSTPERRACITRYGAIGDMVIVTPLIRALAEDGFAVSVNTTGYSAAVLDNNPYVSNILNQERNIIPNQELGAYWDEWRPAYEKYIGLSESLEGALLKLEGRREFFTTSGWRRDTCGGVNYYDRTLALGGYPHITGRSGEIYFSKSELKEIDRIKRQNAGRFVIGCALVGSSHHKAYPLLPPVLNDWLEAHPAALAILLGDDRAAPLVWEHPQIVSKVGQTSLRQSFCLAAASDCILAPETALANVGGALGVPTITLLSHSSHSNLCSHWPSDFCLSPDVSISPCYPCHQLHYSLESCPQGTICDAAYNEPLASGPLCCMGAISGDRVQSRLSEVFHLARP